MLHTTSNLPRLCPAWVRRIVHHLGPSQTTRVHSTFRKLKSVQFGLSCHERYVCCSATASARTTTPLLHSHEYSLPPLQVRPHEVDQYSVVNNAVFVQYLQHEDLEDREEIAAFAVSELTVKYMAPLRARDMYIVTVGIKEYTRTRVICAQRIIRLDPENEKSDRVVVEALATVVLLDANYRPLRMPAFFKQAIENYYEAHAS